MKNKIKHLCQAISVTSLLLGLSGCALLKPPKPSMTPLEVELMQSKTFNVNKKALFNATMSVFQNQGYIIQSASLATGFITAKSPSHTSNTPENASALSKALASLFSTTNYTYDVMATALVTERGSTRSHVRLNLVAQSNVSTKSGQNSSNDTPILNAKVYQNLFTRIEQSIFVSTGIQPTVIHTQK